MNTTTQESITINNVADKMWNDMPKYAIQPMYLLRINQEYCTYEVLVNDFPVYKNYDLGVNATGIKINKAILKSGEQTVTLRMYPIGNLEQEAYGDEMPYYKTLKGGSSMRIEVIKIPDWKNYDIAAEEIIKVVTTEGFDTNKFPGAGLPYYEFTFSFTAEVPYENEGWSNGIDLRKIDSTILKKKIWNYFKMYQRAYEEKDINKIVNIEYDNEVRVSSSEYEKKKDISGIWDEYKNDINIEDKEFQYLKDYELVFYGGGRIVTFKHSSHLDIDSRLRGRSALYFLYDDQSRVCFLGLYLYMDKDTYNGKEEDLQLEIIK
ncbi:hypothetical protein J2Q11_13500 [Tenacibaculum finnmarkense genomovar finnmarkense]|nr:hypothetical protein [Tenacibaculum finnmarkense]MCD8418714.1 hypothetical protein [Tenacibaculum finnmarkense genomovar finnmarkense]MCG8187027.1 hypothetical protein [Tenacibaculum finnmarkense genomovar finnmarkense]MCG8203556.1 hypothetical protein [Tenacibaculum finnmarkense genomovar finnmarkense]MCG8211055.1 hypothetical protein [Tenacibaculum finnmarkense genomovar finnmarkense]MCG8213829.1 hypothetical protein [Tenacibaculum finnmarkense genomovar finnmarkense]